MRSRAAPSTTGPVGRQDVAAEQHQGRHGPDARGVVGDVERQREHQREDRAEREAQDRHPEVGRVGDERDADEARPCRSTAATTSCGRRAPSRSATSGTPIVVNSPIAVEDGHQRARRGRRPAALDVDVGDPRRDAVEQDRLQAEHEHEHPGGRRSPWQPERRYRRRAAGRRPGRATARARRRRTGTTRATARAARRATGRRRRAGSRGPPRAPTRRRSPRRRRRCRAPAASRSGRRRSSTGWRRRCRSPGRPRTSPAGCSGTPGTKLRTTPNAAISAMHAANASRGPRRAASRGPNGANRPMHRTGIVVSSPAVAAGRPRSSRISGSSGPIESSCWRSASEATNRPATTARGTRGEADDTRPMLSDADGRPAQARRSSVAGSGSPPNQRSSTRPEDRRRPGPREEQRHRRAELDGVDRAEHVLRRCGPARRRRWPRTRAGGARGPGGRGTPAPRRARRSRRTATSRSARARRPAGTRTTSSGPSCGRRGAPRARAGTRAAGPRRSARGRAPRPDCAAHSEA